MRNIIALSALFALVACTTPEPISSARQGIGGGGSAPCAECPSLAIDPCWEGDACAFPNVASEYLCGGLENYCAPCTSPGCVEARCKPRAGLGEACSLLVDVSCAAGLVCGLGSGVCE